MKIVKNVDLHFKDNYSDKVYHVALCKDESGGYTVDFAYGRRFSALNYGSKTASPCALANAEKIFNRLVAEKTGKGYKNAPGVSGVVFRGQTDETNAGESLRMVSSPAGGGKVSAGVVPQLLNPIDAGDAERFINDPGWGAQEKFDGKRLMIKCEGGKVNGINRKGFFVVVPPAVADAVKSIGQALLLDGELIGETYYAFGLLEVDGKDLRKNSYIDAYNTLAGALALLGEEHRAVVLAPLAVTTAKKKKLFDSLTAGEKEGMVFKRLDQEF